MRAIRYILLIVCGLGVFGLWLFYPVHLEKPKTVNIKPGTSVRDIGVLLRDSGIIRHAYSLYLLHLLHGDNLQAGEYEFQGKVSPIKLSSSLRAISNTSLPSGIVIL
jgi:cell division protein YceG involved in septum cleavage